MLVIPSIFFFFFFNDTATTEIYTLSLHDALPIWAVALESARQAERGRGPMLELPELTPESFEILAVRELRKVGLEVSPLRVHRRATLPEPERGYLLELKGVISRARWQRRILIACRR